MSTNDSEARGLLQEEASAAGEQLLWWGRPAPRRLALRALPASIFGVPFTAFALFWMWGAAGGLSRAGDARGPGLLFAAFGLPFVLVGMGLLLSPLFTLAGARRTLYGVTTGGILIVKAGRSRRVERHPLPGDDVLHRSQRADGSGDLVVARSASTDGRGRATVRTVTFVGIPDVARVERIVADASRSAPDRAPPAAPFPAARRRGADLPAYPSAEARRLPTLLVLALGVTIGFVVAVVLARAGRLPIAATAPAAPAGPAVVPQPQPSGSPPPSAPGLAADGSTPHDASGDPACDAGDGAACARAARDAYERMGTADRARGAAIATRGCDLGSAAACAYLAWILDGNGGIELADARAALRAAERGCDLGSSDACRTAGFALAYGRPGIAPDRARAEPYLESACASDHAPRACAALGDLLAARGDRTRAGSVLSACCSRGDTGCCSQRNRLTGGR